jgi:hypothetical protein
MNPPSLPTFTSTLDTMSRKRPHGELASSPPSHGYNPNKSHRVTPTASPRGTTPGTPGSDNSLDAAERAFAQQYGMFAVFRFRPAFDSRNRQMSTILH